MTLKEKRALDVPFLFFAVTVYFTLPEVARGFPLSEQSFLFTLIPAGSFGSIEQLVGSPPS